MNLPTQTAKHIRDVYFGGNWTVSNLKDQLADVSWQEATTQVYGLNTIATLTFHIHYFVQAVTKVLQGEPLTANDKYSFAHPPIQSQADWENLLQQTWTEGQAFADLIEQLPENRFWEDFTDNKYGSYYRNLHGIIEHTHYHLGQIAIIKKTVRQIGENGNDSI